MMVDLNKYSDSTIDMIVRRPLTELALELSRAAKAANAEPGLGFIGCGDTYLHCKIAGVLKVALENEGIARIQLRVYDDGQYPYEVRVRVNKQLEVFGVIDKNEVFFYEIMDIHKNLQGSKSEDNPRPEVTIFRPRIMEMLIAWESYERCRNKAVADGIYSSYEAYEARMLEVYKEAERC